MSYMQTKLVSHAARVRILYKEALRQTQSYYYYSHLFRYHAALMRQRFEENKDVDPQAAKKLLEDGEKELFLKQHPQPLRFANSPGGSAYGREAKVPDWYLDVWHPLERAQYPEYFALREQRKKEYIERWENKYGKMEQPAH